MFTCRYIIQEHLPQSQSNVFIRKSCRMSSHCNELIHDHIVFEAVEEYNMTIKDTCTVYYSHC